MTLEIVKAVPSYKNSYQKTKIGGLLRSLLDLFVTFLLPKTAGFLAEDSLDTFNNQLKWKYNWKSDQKQFTNYNYNYVSFVSFVSSLFIVIVVIRILSSKGVRYNTLSYPRFILICFKLAHITSHWILTSMDWFRSLRVPTKYRPLFCRANFQTIWLRKNKKSWTFCCQNNRTSELYYVRGFLRQWTSNCEDYTTYLHLHQINLHRIIFTKLFHQKIGFSSSGLFIN
jgi:hypothetical protein